MDTLEIGDLVVLVAGSMRMAVESVDGTNIGCVWCHEGHIGRDSFDARLLRKWEHRDDDRPPHRSSGGPGSGKPYRGDRDGGSKPHGGDRPRGKTGWDGKPRDKKYYRKDG